MVVQNILNNTKRLQPFGVKWVKIVKTGATLEIQSARSTETCTIHDNRLKVCQNIIAIDQSY